MLFLAIITLYCSESVSVVAYNQEVIGIHNKTWAITEIAVDIIEPSNSSLKIGITRHLVVSQYQQQIGHKCNFQVAHRQTVVLQVEVFLFKSQHCLRCRHSGSTYDKNLMVPVNAVP